MPLRVQQELTKFTVAVDGDLRVQNAVSKFGITTGDTADLRVQNVVTKFLVRSFPIITIPQNFPPFDTTISQAPYVMVR